jgi:hypothetical protein
VESVVSVGNRQRKVKALAPVAYKLTRPGRRIRGMLVERLVYVGDVETSQRPRGNNAATLVC